MGTTLKLLKNWKVVKFVHNKNVIISKSVENFLDSYSSQFLPKETGGILLGFEDDKKIYITHATEAGLNAKHSNFRFTRDQKYCKNELDRIFVETNCRCDYIGEWHSHPFNCSISPLDIISLISLKLNPSNNVDNPILLININEGNRWRKDIFVFEKLRLYKINI